MNNQFDFTFRTHQSLRGEKYSWEGRQYLLCSITANNCLITEPLTHLLIPDDNSLLANHIRNNPQGGEFFSIPLSDLKFLPKLFKKNDDLDLNQSAFLIKSTSQIKKITEKEVHFPQILTFKVKKQWKFRGELYAAGTYEHYLEIEPFSLGLEGWPEISKITFGFGFGSSLERTPGSLMKSWLYNHKILEESVGKTFTMKINWLLKGENNNELLFFDLEQFDVGSFQEKTAENGNYPTSPNQPKNNDNSASLIIGIVIIFAILALTIGFLVAKKRKK